MRLPEDNIGRALQIRGLRGGRLLDVHENGYRATVWSAIKLLAEEFNWAIVVSIACSFGQTRNSNLRR